MTFFKLCKYDLKNGMLKEGLKYLLVCCTFFWAFVSALSIPREQI